MYKYFLAWRYLHTKLIALFGVAAVMLCVAMVLVVTSVMGGFLDTIRTQSKGLHSEIVLEAGTLQGFPLYDEFTNHLARKLPLVVKRATPAIVNYSLFRVPVTTLTKPARVLGIRFDDYVQVNHFKQGLHYERFFPGTTTLAPQGIPVAGINDEGALKLPPDLEAAAARRATSDVAAPFEATPYPLVVAAVPAATVFAAAAGEPRYEEPAFDGVIVGCDLLNDRRADGNFDRLLARGAPVALMLIPLSVSGNPTGEPPVRVPLRYVDDSRTGIYEIDSMSVYVDFDMLQHKLGMDAQQLADGGTLRPRASQLLVALKDGVDLDVARNQIASEWFDFTEEMAAELSDADQRMLNFVGVYTWEDLQRPFIAAVEKEKVLVTILFGLISMVAIVLVGCIFYMIVEKKTKDIGIMKALGASSTGVAGLFMFYACAVGIVGSALGVIFGSWFVWNINGIQDFLANLNPQLRVWSPDVYSFDRIPEVVKGADVVFITLVAVLSSVLGSVIPAIIAGRVWPVQALRYE